MNFHRSNLHAALWGGVDYDDFVRCLNEADGNGLGDVLMGDGLDLAALFLNMLQVEGGDDRDAGVEQLRHVLPALLVVRTGRIVVGQAVYKTDLGFTAKNRRSIHHGGAVDFQQGKDLKRRHGLGHLA